MKKFFFISLLLTFKISFSQTLPKFDEIKLEKASDYKAADSFALAASTYLLSTPFDKNNLDRAKSLVFILKWMEGTPDYGFTYSDVPDKFLKKNDDLMGAYTAAMVKYAIENKSNAPTTEVVKLNAIKLLLSYCEDPRNNMKMTKQLQKLSEANKKGELEKSF